MTMCRIPRLLRASIGAFVKVGFDIDIKHYPLCGENLKIILATLKSNAITKILNNFDSSVPRYDHLQAAAVSLAYLMTSLFL